MYLKPLLFSAGWSVLFPAWQLLEQTALPAGLGVRPGSLAWPYSSLLQLSAAGLPALTFVWMGFLLYSSVCAESECPESWIDAVRGMSASLSVLLLSTMLLLAHLKNPLFDLGSIGRDGFFLSVHVSAVSLPLMLSLLTATLSSRPPRVSLPRRRAGLATRLRDGKAAD